MFSNPEPDLHRADAGVCEAAVVLAAPVAALSLACNIRVASATVKSTRLTIPGSQSISGESFRADPKLVDSVICLPLPGGRTAMVLTIASGGTAGDVNWAIYVGGPGAYTLSLVRGGYKLSLARKGADVVETDPVYKTNDPNCCPTGGFDHTQWHWSGTKFVVARSWHNQTYKP